jgi:predicted anti-sigma-YlaC factor YlaD
MKCEKIGILLSAHIDKEVTEQERRLVENHLKVCENCKRSVSAFFEVHGLYRDMPVAEPLPGFRQRVTQRLEKEPRLSLFEVWWRKTPLVYVIPFVLLILVSGIVLLQVAKQPDLQAVDVYAEDILFGQVESTVDDIFTLERTSVTDEIVEMFYFDEADNTSFFENEPLSSDGTLYMT